MSDLSPKIPVIHWFDRGDKPVCDPYVSLGDYREMRETLEAEIEKLREQYGKVPTVVHLIEQRDEAKAEVGRLKVLLAESVVELEEHDCEYKHHTRGDLKERIRAALDAKPAEQCDPLKTTAECLKCTPRPDGGVDG